MMKKIKKLAICLGLAAAFTLTTACTGTASAKTDVLPQFSELKEGEDIAVVTTDMGVVKLRFFPEYAPKSVENFITHANNKYYDGLIFHRVIKDFVIQSGDPTGTGSGGESIYDGKGFETEVAPQLHHLRGALGMAKSADPNSNGSQFYIVQNTKLSEDAIGFVNSIKEQADQKATVNEKIGEKTIGELFPTAILDSYLKDGGTPQLDLQYTVFGQVIEGLDVVDKIGTVETVTGDKPKEDVHIKTIVMEKYKK